MAADRVDLFVSYAHADDQPADGRDRGWVTTLAAELQKLLGHLGHSLDGGEFWMDHQLAAGENVDDALLGRVRSSRTLLLVMSPAYQGSVWCQRELGNFVTARSDGAGAGTTFVVETEPVERSSWHPALRSLKAQRFWAREFEDRAPHQLGWPDPKDDRSYWRAVNELGHDISEAVRNRGPAASPKSAVWIAEPTEDLLEERDRLASAMRQGGFDVLPVSDYPRESQVVWREELQRDMERAQLLVQLLGPREGRKPVWSEQSFVALQAEAARAVAAARAVRFLRWRSPQADPAKAPTAEYRTLLEGVPACGIEELRTDALRAAASPAPAAPAQQAAPDDGTPYIYVSADAVDRDLAHAIQESLSAFDVDVALTPEPGPGCSPGQIRQAQQDQLESCDGVVIVYGNTPATWVQSQFAISRRVLGQRWRHGIWGALLEGPPAEKPAPGLSSPNMMLLDCRGGVDQEKLAGFVRNLKALEP